MSSLRKRSLVLKGASTSLALEPDFWAALQAMAAGDGLSLPEMVTWISLHGGDVPLASACRVAALRWARGPW